MPEQVRQFVFQGAQSQWMLVCHFIAVLTAVLLIVVLSRYERKLVSPTLGNLLLSLRLAVLAVILMTLLQPTVTWTLQQKQTGRILVGIDLSKSMSTIDRHASQAEKLRIARGLELIGNAATDARLDRWQKSFDLNQEPEWVDPGEANDQSNLKVLSDSRKENLRSIFAEIDKLPRSEIARRLCQATPDPLLDRLKKLNRVELFVFAGKIESAEPEALSGVIADPPSTLLTDNTDLSVAMQSGSIGTGEVLGIILFTDGRDHSNQPLAGIAAGLKGVNSPIYPVLIGSEYRPRDLSILQLDHPQAVYKGDHPLLKVTIGAVGFDGKTIDVEVHAENEPDSEPLAQSVLCTGSTIMFEFSLDAGSLGRKKFVVKTPVLPGETREDNNSRSFSFNVIDDRSKVLLVDGEARWEFRYLDTALRRDDRIDLTHVLFDQPFLGLLPDPFFPRMLPMPDESSDNAVTPFTDRDLVIIGDVSPQQVTDVVWQQILKFVSEGGTLVLSAGKRYLPLEHRSPALEQLLPITKPTAFAISDANPQANRQGLPIQLTADGEQQPMLQFAPDLAQNIALWKGLPGPMWAMLGNAKPGATVWATTMVPAGGAEGLAVDRKLGIILHQYVGSGQVVWLGTDATWRWRYRVGDQYHHRFWGQMSRWAAANKMSAGTEFVRFGVEKTDLEAGQSATIRARWTHLFLSKFPQMKARADLFRKQDPDGQPFTSIELTPIKGQPLQSEGHSVPLPAGEYQVRLAANQAELGDKRIETTFIVHDKPNLELMDVSVNRDQLIQIAETSGGRLFLPDQVRELPSLFKKVNETTTEYHEFTLWDRWPWLVLLFTLMTAEWVIRKYNGLP